jgi:adenylate cyclase
MIEPMATSGEKALQRRLAAILSADIAGYSRLMGADAVATVHTLSEYRAVVRATG